MRIFRLVLGLVLAMSPLSAHFSLLQPASIHASENGGKGAGPCGEGTDSNVVTAVQGGHALPHHSSKTRGRQATASKIICD